MNTKDIYICKIATCLILPEIFHKVSPPQASFKTFLFTMASFPPDIDKFIDSDVDVGSLLIYCLQAYLVLFTVKVHYLGFTHRPLKLMHH